MSQSNPNWPYGYEPSPGEWNEWWSKKLDAPEYGLDAARAGTSDASTALVTAFTSVSDIQLLPGTYLINQNITIPNGKVLRFLDGASLLISNGVTLTINGVVIAPHKAYIFQIVGTGSVLGLRHVTPYWFGALGNCNGTTGNDDAPALNAAELCLEASYPSDGDRPTFDFGSGNFGIGSQLVWRPRNSNCVWYKGQGCVLNGGTIFTILPSFSTTGPAIFVRGATDASGQVVDWKMTGFAVENAGGSALAGIQIGTSGETLNGWHENLIEDVKVGQFNTPWQVQNVRLLRFRRCSAWNGNLAGTSFYITAQPGDFTGDMTFEDLNLVPNATTGTALTIQANGAGANVSGIRFDPVFPYYGLNNLIMSAVGGGIIDDIWFQPGCQFQGPCANYMIKINASGQDGSGNASRINNIHFPELWMEEQNSFAMIEVGSDGVGTFYGVSFGPNAWYGNSNKQVAVVSNANNIKFDGGTVYDTLNTTGNMFEITNSTGCKVIDIDTQRPAGSPGYYQNLILLAGTSDHFVYGGNNLNGIPAVGELSNTTSPAATHIGQIPSAN